MDFTTWVQTRLNAHGYLVDIDGIAGPRTADALKQFQKAHGLRVRGVATRETVEMLRVEARQGRVVFTKPKQELPEGMVNEPPWFARARGFLGVTEAKGPRNNPKIMDWAEQTGIDYPGDDTPWCGLFAAAVMSYSFPSDPVPTNPLLARSWLRYGEASDPRGGAIVVFWRGDRAGWQGHVGFVAGFTSTHVACLGGNQSNEVNIRLFPKSRVLGYRWPRWGAPEDFPADLGLGVYVETPAVEKKKLDIPVTEGEQ